jgi:hypothetical protein
MTPVLPSSVTIVEQEDIHVCELPSSITDRSCVSPLMYEQPTGQINHLHEFPFEFLPGEKSLDYAMDLTDGFIYLTTYRLFTFSNQTLHCSFVNYPLRLIESIDIKDNIYLVFQCKDIRSFRLMFFTSDKCSSWLKRFHESIILPHSIDDLFTMKYASARSNDDHQNIKRHYIRDECVRLQLDVNPWRLTEVNHDYKLCTSYPSLCAVPASITDEDILAVAKFRSYARFPSIVWR